MGNGETEPKTPATLDSDDVVTVTQLTTEISEVVENRSQLSHDYVVGDVSDSQKANGHLHFDLVAEEASIHCVVFGFRDDKLTARPTDDMQVAVQGDLSFYQAQGSCSIIVEDVVDMGESQHSQI